MSSKVTTLVAVGVALAVLAGCQAQQRTADLGGEGTHLFGATPLPLGQEDMGYFAYVPRTVTPLLMFDSRSAYVQSYTWEVEDNRRPDLSYYRRQTRSEETYFYER